MEILYKVGSAFLLLVGGLYPLAAIYIMMKSLSPAGDALTPRRPAPATLMLHFILIATVPLAGILGGFAGFAPELWESQVIRLVVYGAGALSLVAFVMLLFSMRSLLPGRLIEPGAERDQGRGKGTGA